MSAYYFIVAKRQGEDYAALTAESFDVDSGTLREMIETYYNAIGEQEPYFGWLDDPVEVETFEDVVVADDCTDPEVCLKTLTAFR